MVVASDGLLGVNWFGACFGIRPELVDGFGRNLHASRDGEHALFAFRLQFCFGGKMSTSTAFWGTFSKLASMLCRKTDISCVFCGRVANVFSVFIVLCLTRSDCSSATKR